MRKATSVMMAAVVIAVLGSTAAEARSIRVDAGDWDLSGFMTGGSATALAFGIDILGVNAQSASFSPLGQITLLGAGGAIDLFAFQDASQGSGGATIQYQVGTTNANFNAPGVDAGLRVTWFSRDAAGALQNEYQASIFSLAGGSQFAIEYNYNSILAGGAASRVGYSASTGTNFDLLATLGLSFAQYSGVGDDLGSTNCANTPSALACNNFFAGTYGPGAAVLPNVANGFFTQIDSNGGTPQGRALFLFNANGTPVPEPRSLALLVLGFLASSVALRRRAHAPLR